jgi:hypothetical protein
MRRDQVFTDEQQKQQGHEVKPSWVERLSQWIQENHDRQPTLGAELAAMGREAIKDIRQTLNETYFGKPENASEPGTPLSPTMQEVSVDRGVVGQYQAMLDSYASRGNVHGHEQDRSREQER